MDNLISLDKKLEIWVPISIVQFQFSIKESIQLTNLHIYLLEAINNNDISIDEIVDATQLAFSVIEQEIHELFTEKLISKDDSGKYQITELARRLLLYKELITEMNNKQQQFIFDNTTSEITINDNSLVCNKPNGVCANKLVSVLELDCFEPLEQKELLIDSYECLRNIEDDIIDDFLENIIFEVKNEKISAWKKKYITKMPSEIINDSTNAIKMLSYVIEYHYEVFDEFFDKNENLLSAMEVIADYNQSLLATEAISILNRWHEYIKCKKQDVILFYNPISKLISNEEIKIPRKEKKYIFDLQDFNIQINNDDSMKSYLEEIQEKYDFKLREKKHVNIKFTLDLPKSCITNDMEEES